MIFQEFLDNSYDETENTTSPLVNLTLTLEQSLYIARVLAANNSGRVHDVTDYELTRLFNSANSTAIETFYGNPLDNCHA